MQKTSKISKYYPQRVLRIKGLSFPPLALRPSLVLFFALLSHFLLQDLHRQTASAASITLSIPSELTLNLSNSGERGGFSKSPSVYVRVKTDSPYGFTFSIKSKSGRDLINGSSRLSSISSPLSEEAFSSSGTVNTWGYLPNRLNSAANSDFQPAPTSSPTVIEETNLANPTSPRNYDFALGAKVGSEAVPGTYSNSFVLTAVVNNPKYIQNFPCKLEEGEVMMVADSRDGTEYTVTKLKDGKCWMTKDLALGKVGSTIKLTPDDTDIPADYTLPASNIDGFSEQDTPYVYIDGSYGGFYSWNAATAGEGDQTIASGDTTQSICPVGWRIPSSLEYDALSAAYGGENEETSLTLKSAPANFSFSGQYTNGALMNRGKYGYRWSTTAWNSVYAEYFSIYDSKVSTVRHMKYYGNNVRCVTRLVTTYNITYEDISALGSGIPEKQSGKTQAGRVKLSDATPTREGYVFKGWCNKYTSNHNCSGETYQPGEYLPVKDGGTSSPSIYAIWHRPYMQNFSCRLSQDETTILMDNRDWNEYPVTKLKDGKCWMTENLKIARKTLTPDDSDVSENFYLPGSSTSGFSNYGVANVYVDSTYGGYYTWYGATVGEGNSSKSSGDTAHSICPKNWRLPTSAEYSALVEAYGGNTTKGIAALKNEPVNFLLPGYYMSSSLKEQNTIGLYWSSTAATANQTFALSLSDSTIDASQKNYKYRGYSVRCVSR